MKFRMLEGMVEEKDKVMKKIKLDWYLIHFLFVHSYKVLLKTKKISHIKLKLLDKMIVI